MGSEFDTCWLKIGRAEEHWNILCAENKAWVDGTPYNSSKRCNEDGSRHSFVVDEIKKHPPLDRWSLIAGDCIHNLRSTLDALVYVLAVRQSGCNPPPDEKKLQFPIVDTPEGFEEQRFRIATLGTPAQTLIERMQPYNRPHPELPPLLSLLRDFSNRDKHRLLNVVIANIQEVLMREEYLGDAPQSIQRGYHQGPIQTGTEVAFVSVSPPRLDLTCHFKALIGISMEHPPGPSGRTFRQLVEILKLLMDEVKKIVEEAI